MLADGTASAASMPSIAVSIERSAFETGVANATWALTRSRLPAALRVASAESVTPPGAITQIMAAAAAMAVTAAGPTPRVSSFPIRRRAPMPSAAAPVRSASAKPVSAMPRLFAPMCAGRYTASASSGPPMAAPTSPIAAPPMPLATIVIASARRRRLSSSTRAHARAATSVATMSASAGMTMLASRKPVSSSAITAFDG